MQQANTLGIAAGNVIGGDHGTQITIERRLKRTLVALRRGRRRLFDRIRVVLSEITSDPKPNPEYYLGTYASFLDSTKPPIHKNN